MTFENTVLHEFLTSPAFTPRWASDMRKLHMIGYRVWPALSGYWVYRTVSSPSPQAVQYYRNLHWPQNWSVILLY